MVVTGAKEEDALGGRDGDVGKGVGHDVAAVAEACMWSYDSSCFWLSGGVGGGGVVCFFEPLVHFSSQFGGCMHIC